MSIFASIANAEHTAVAWIEQQLAKLQTEAPKIEAVADAGLKYASIALTIVGQQVGPNTESGKVISEALKDITTLSAVVYDAGASPTLGSEVSAIVNNLSGLLSVGHVTNANSVATITKVISTLGALVSAFAAVPAPPAV